MLSKVSSINGIKKVSVISALLAGSAALYSSNSIKLDAQPNQTEVVSRAGADAVKSSVLAGVNQAAVPTVHNQRIDNTFRKFATNEEDKKVINSVINSIYNVKGTFLASAELQHEIDRQQLYLLLEEKGDLLVKNNINPKLGERVKTIGPDFYKSVRPNAKEVEKWLNESYTPSFLNLLSFDHKPTADEILKKIDDIAINKANFGSNERLDYRLKIDNFKKESLNNRKDNQALSELIAFKIFVIDKIIFKKTLKNSNFFGENSDFGIHGNLSYYYNLWIDTVKPTGK